MLRGEGDGHKWGEGSSLVSKLSWGETSPGGRGGIRESWCPASSLLRLNQSVRGGGLLHWVLTVVPLLPCLAGEEAEAQTGWLTSLSPFSGCRAELHNSSSDPRACAMRQHHTSHMKLNMKRTEKCKLANAKQEETSRTHSEVSVLNYFPLEGVLDGTYSMLTRGSQSWMLGGWLAVHVVNIYTYTRTYTLDNWSRCSLAAPL